MPMDNQFSLSLELTRLAPLGLAAISKTYEGAMKLARDLQSSGSDIVVEEDLAELFGRGRITDSVAKSFRAEMSKTDPTINLVGSLSLMRGPGPTVMRALVEPAYFSTVVQCSYLVSIHKPSSLATVIVNHLETLAEQTPPHTLRRTIPSYESVKGTLLACETQTTTYQWNWRMQLLAVGSVLGCGRHERESTMPPRLLQGLIVTLPLIQTLPDDRFVMVEANSGICTIVVWAHFLLGLRVAVRFYHESGEGYREMHFPQTDDFSYQVLIYMNISHSQWAERAEHSLLGRPSITLFSSSTGDQLFEMKEDPRGGSISENFKRPARGIWQNFFEAPELLPRRTGREKILQEMGYIACSFALCISRKMYRKSLDRALIPPRLEQDNLTALREASDKCPFDEPQSPGTDPKRILESFSMLVGMRERDVLSEKCHQYASCFEGTRWDEIHDPPNSIRLVLEEWVAANIFKSVPSIWTDLREAALKFSVIILAFANVAEIDACSELPLFARVDPIVGLDIVTQVRKWDGKADLLVAQNSWFETITFLMFGERNHMPNVQNTALISESGWSLYTSSLVQLDPLYVDPTLIIVQRGIPWRHGICKRRVVDGPVALYPEMIICNSSPTITFPGQVKLECAKPLEFGRLMVGEQDDSFLITTSVENVDEDSAGYYYRFGFYQLWRSIWGVCYSSRCPHPTRLGASLELQPGWMTISGPGNLRENKYQNLNIFLTAGNPGARWNVMLRLADTLFRPQLGTCRIFLRRPDTCLQCAAEEAGRHTPRSFLIL